MFSKNFIVLEEFNSTHVDNLSNCCFVISSSVFKLYLLRNKNFALFNNNNYLFLFDEVDFLSNPYTSELNISVGL